MSAVGLTALMVLMAELAREVVARAQNVELGSRSESVSFFFGGGLVVGGLLFSFFFVQFFLFRVFFFFFFRGCSLGWGF